MAKPTCLFETCKREACSQGLCDGHRQQRKAGRTLQPLRPMTRGLPADVRFWSKVDKTDTCWLWMGTKKDGDYGIFQHGGRAGGNTLAHRYAWEVTYGPIPDGLPLDHRCHVHPCVNPAHLRIVTTKQNSENRKGAHSTSGTGVRGVSWDKSKRLYRATVTHNYKQIHVGRYRTIPEAEAAVIAKRNELFTHNDLDRRL